MPIIGQDLVPYNRSAKKRNIKYSAVAHHS